MNIYNLSTIAIFTAFLTACSSIKVDTQSSVEIPVEFDKTQAAKGRMKFSNGGETGTIHN